MEMKIEGKEIRVRKIKIYFGFNNKEIALPLSTSQITMQRFKHKAIIVMQVFKFSKKLN